MAKLTVFYRNKGGDLPPQFLQISPDEEAAIGPIALTPREVKDLERTGVWPPEGDPQRAQAWVRPGPDGEVWAGCFEGSEAPVAKVRGKGGRRLGGARLDRKVPAPRKQKTNSIQMSPATRRRLDALAAHRTEAEGRKVTVSIIINELLAAHFEAIGWPEDAAPPEQ